MLEILEMGKPPLARSSKGQERHIVFIAGAGRSGSTALELALAEHLGGTAVGELRHIWQRGFIENQLCGCRKPVLACELWADVRRDLAQTLGPDFAMRAERNRRAAERLAQCFGILPLLRKFAFSCQSVQSYLRAMRALYLSLARYVPLPLVDSSKDLGHALLLANLFPRDLSCVLIIRDPREVAYAWKYRTKPRPEIQGEIATMPRYSVLRTALAWTVNTLGVFVFLSRLNIPILIVPFETFRAHGTASVEMIAEWISGAERNTGPGFWSHHGVGGNPLRWDFKKFSNSEEASTAKHDGKLGLLERLPTDLICGLPYMYLRSLATSLSERVIE